MKTGLESCTAGFQSSDSFAKSNNFIRDWWGGRSDRWWWWWCLELSRLSSGAGPFGAAMPDGDARLMTARTLPLRLVRLRGGG